MGMVLESKALLSVGLLALLLGGCGHKELKSPCAPLAQTAFADECGPERPINVAMLAGALQ